MDWGASPVRERIYVRFSELHRLRAFDVQRTQRAIVYSDEEQEPPPI